MLHELYLQAVRDHNVLPLTGRCNLRCIFCSHRQNPAPACAYDFPPLSLDLIRQLIPFLNAGSKIIIGESATRLREGEPLTHPHFISVMEYLRGSFPDTLIQITTNAGLLDSKTVKQLLPLYPLEMNISLNSSSTRGRRMLMGDKNPEKAFDAVDLLSATPISFHGSLVAMPHLVGWEDLTSTLRFMDARGALSLRLLLPGFTRRAVFGTEVPPGIWEACRDYAQNIKTDLSAPLIVEPSHSDDLTPFIGGVIRGTPASRAGLAAGDSIQEIDGRKPESRVEAFHMVRGRSNPTIKIERNGDMLDIFLQKKKGVAPGFIVSYDLDPAQVKRVRRFLPPGGETLMLLSTAALDLWKNVREKYNFAGLRLAPVPSKFFGGNINCAGLLTLGDFSSVLERELSGTAPAAILLPALAFNSGGYDMAGEHYDKLNSFGVEIALVD